MPDKKIKEIRLGIFDKYNSYLGLGKVPKVCACCGKMDSFPSKTITYGDDTVEVISTPMHSVCDNATLKKIRDYSYLSGNKITSEVIANIMGIARPEATKIFNYYYKTGVLEVMQNDSSKEALDEYLNEVDKTNIGPNNAALADSFSKAGNELSESVEQKTNQANTGYRSDISRWRR